MIDEMDIAALVPECYAQYRRIVAEGVMFFLEHLSQARLEAILAEQAELPADADVPTRLLSVLHACPALHKLGQVIARRRELDPALRTQLQRLESMRPRTRMEQVRPIIARELEGATHRYRVRLGAAPLAEASVAVVVPFEWADPVDWRGNHRQRGVLKVLKPNIAGLLDEDLNILARLADYVDERRGQYGLPEIDYRDTFDEARAILVHEVRLDGEQSHLAAAGEHYRNWPGVDVPRLLPFSTRHITAMARVDGIKVTEMCRSKQGRRRDLAETIVRALVAEPILSRQENVLFHGDPHAGNLMACSDGRLGILDWSLTGHLTLREREQMLQVLVGGISMDSPRIARAIASLASSGATDDRLRPIISRALADAQGKGLPGVGWLMRLLDSAARAGVRFRPGLMLFRKAYFTLEGVVSDLCGACRIGQILTKAMLEQFAAEWPLRWLRPPTSRAFATHLSNADLMRIVASLPVVATNWWMQRWRLCGM